MPRSGQYWRNPERLEPVGTSVGRGGKGLVAPHRFRPATRAVRSGRRDRGLLEHSPTPASSSPLAMTSPTRTFCNPGSARGSIRTLERPKLQPRKITNPSTNTPPPPYYPGEQKHLSPRARPLAGLPVCDVRSGAHPGGRFSRGCRPQKPAPRNPPACRPGRTPGDAHPRPARSAAGHPSATDPKWPRQAAPAGPARAEVTGFS